MGIDKDNYEVQPNHILIGKFIGVENEGAEVAQVTRVLYPKDKQVRHSLLEATLRTGGMKGKSLYGTAYPNKTAFFKSEEEVFDFFKRKGVLLSSPQTEEDDDDDYDEDDYDEDDYDEDDYDEDDEDYDEDDEEEEDDKVDDNGESLLTTSGLSAQDIIMMIVVAVSLLAFGFLFGVKVGMIAEEKLQNQKAQEAERTTP